MGERWGGKSSSKGPRGKDVRGTGGEYGEVGQMGGA